MPSRSSSLLLASIILGALALTGVLVARFVGAQEDDTPPRPTEVWALPREERALPNLDAYAWGALDSRTFAEMIGRKLGSLLFTTNRTHLSLCVDGAGGFSVSEAEIESVRQALDDAVAVVPSLPSEFQERAVSEGCATATALIGRPLEDDEWDIGVVRVGFVGPTRGSRDPSPHRLFVYFVSPDAYAAHFGTRPYFRTWAEHFCGGDKCTVVTGALYVPPSVTSDALREGLIDSLSLRPLLEQE